MIFSDNIERNYGIPPAMMTIDQIPKEGYPIETFKDSLLYKALVAQRDLNNGGINTSENFDDLFKDIANLTGSLDERIIKTNLSIENSIFSFMIFWGISHFDMLKYIDDTELRNKYDDMCRTYFYGKFNPTTYVDPIKELIKTVLSK
jgi:hypothetical protein